MIHTAIVSHEISAQRLDDAIARLFGDISKTRARKIIDLGGCTVNQVMVRVASREVHQGDEIIVGVMEDERFVDVILKKEELLFEDRHYLSLHKAPGINSQRTPYQLKGTVEYAVAIYLKGEGSSEPARVIHRLDRGTSGVMFFPKNKQAATHISNELKNSRVEKVYWAIVADLPEQEKWRVDAPIGKLNKFRYGVTLPGKPSVTDFRVIATAGTYSLIEATPLTGRTHQIRVHLAHSGLPIVGDAPYGGISASRMMLHCRKMGFKDQSGKEITAVAPLEAMMADFAKEIGLTFTCEK